MQAFSDIEDRISALILTAIDCSREVGNLDYDSTVAASAGSLHRAGADAGTKGQEESTQSSIWFEKNYVLTSNDAPPAQKGKALPTKPRDTAEPTLSTVAAEKEKKAPRKGSL